jgi:hypothetical protein
MRSRDGVDIDWPYSDVPGTTLTHAQVVAVLSRDPCERAIAHAELTRGQIDRLYRKTKYLNDLGHRRRLLGKRILQSGLAPYCHGIGEVKLMKVFSPNAPDDKQSRIRALLALS